MASLLGQSSLRSIKVNGPKRNMRFLYLINLETGARAEETDISGMRAMDIIALESRLWAKIDDPWVVRDSALDVAS